MKALLLTLSLLWAGSAFAQGTAIEQMIFSATGRPVPGAYETICVSSATGVPCAPTVTIYSNQELTQAITQPIQADALGNVRFWVAPGNYTYTVTGNGITNSGPFPLTAPCSIGSNCAVIDRIQPSGGSPLTSADFAISGWGSGAAISNIVGTDTAFHFTITAGTSPSVSPTVILTFHDGPWISIFTQNANWNSGTGVASDIQITNNLSSTTMTYMGMPVATKTYTVSVITTGTSIVASAKDQTKAPIMARITAPIEIRGQK